MVIRSIRSIRSIRRDETEKLANSRMPLWRETLNGVKAETGAGERWHGVKGPEKMIVDTKKFQILSGARN
jgi:hypothetical protein